MSKVNKNKQIFCIGFLYVAQHFEDQNDARFHKPTCSFVFVEKTAIISMTDMDMLVLFGVFRIAEIEQKSCQQLFLCKMVQHVKIQISKLAGWMSYSLSSPEKS